MLFNVASRSLLMYRRFDSSPPPSSLGGGSGFVTEAFINKVLLKRAECHLQPDFLDLLLDDS